MSPQKILIIALRQIGDTLITTPLIDDVASTWPDAEIHFLGFASSMGILAGNPHIHTFIASSARPRRKEYLELIQQIARKYDLAITTQPNDRSHLFGLIAAPVRFGVVPNDAKQGWWKRLTCRHIVEVDYFHQHVITEKRKLIPESLVKRARPVSVTPPRFLPLPQNILHFLSENANRKTVLIHATPLGNYKRIATHTWETVLNSLLQTCSVILTGSDSPSDKQLNAELMAQVAPSLQSRVFESAGQLSFGALAQLLSQASLYIGVDTSVSHLAAACDTPSIVLFGPTPPTNFGPWPNGFEGAQPYQLKAREQTVGKITIVQGPGDCVPCRRAGCDDVSSGESQCLMHIDADTILRIAEKKFAGSGEESF